MQPSDIWKAPPQSEGSALDMERNGCSHNCCPSPLQPVASAGQHSESSAAYFSWPTSTLMHGSAEGRANYFGNLQKGVLPGHLGRLPKGQQATTLLDLMIIRAFHSKILRRFSLGTAIGFRIRKGTLTDTPAILVFVARKVNKKWLRPTQCLPAALVGPGGIWCDVDVVEFSYYGAPAPTPKEQLYDELVDGLRGSDPSIGSGSQVASLETYGTLGAIVKSRSGNKQVGFLTNRHVAVDLDYPNQKMFHPLPPNLGPGVYLGAVERATSFITDDVWYGIYAGTNPETFVRADGAFIPFADDFDITNVSTSVKGVGLIEALEEQRITVAAAAAAANSTATESSPVATPQENEKVDKIYEPLGINIQQLPRDGSDNSTDHPNEFHVDTVEGMNNVEERQFIPNLIGMSPMRDAQEVNGEHDNLAELENTPEDICFSLHLGEREPKRLRSDSGTLDIDLQK
ncbi:unnamed protein product [Alopecurus aequalis]